MSNTAPLAILLCLAAWNTAAQPAAPQLPDYLPSYYAPLITPQGAAMPLAIHKNENGDDIYSYVTADQASNLRIDWLACAASACDALFQAAFRASDQMAAAGNGKFDIISPAEFRVSWKSPEQQTSRFVFIMPGAILIWTYARPAGAMMDAYSQSLSMAVNRQRLELARAAGNVEMGRYDGALRVYAEELLKAGQKEEALNVLSAVIATSPTDYQAQMEFAQNSDDAKAAKASAQIVQDNAESPALVAQSAKLLGDKTLTADDIPFLDKGETGLQVILIPLAPCDLYLLKDAGDIYTRITGIPVNIWRLKEDWAFGPPDRIPNERTVQQLIIQATGANVDFSAWTLDQYESELFRLASAARDPAIQYRVNAILDAAGHDGAQYDAAKYVPRLSAILDTYRSADPRTLYVGITGANISTGSANFVFSLLDTQAQHQADILSYYMMKAGSSGAAYESRQRLTERIAKELVPATFNALGIPRSIDPSDPDSYASGVERLDQKTLVLSKTTADALAKFRQ